MIDHIESNAIKMDMLHSLSKDSARDLETSSHPCLISGANNDENCTTELTAAENHQTSASKKSILISNPIQSALSSHLSSLRNRSLSNLGASIYNVNNGSNERLQLSSSPQSPSTKRLLSKFVSSTFSRSSDSESNSSSPESYTLMKLIKRRTKSNPVLNHNASSHDYDSITPVLSNEMVFDIEDYSSLNRISKKIIPDVFTNHGLSMLRVNHKKKTRRFFKIDFDNLVLTWTKSDPQSSSIGKISSLSFDKIKCIRVQHDASNYREEFHISNEFEKTWCSIIYLSDKNKLKGLHVIADTENDFQMFCNTVSALKKYRQQLIKNFLVGIDDLKNFKDLTIEDSSISKPEKEVLTFNDILRYSKRLHINISKNHLLDIFHSIDVENNNYLTFDQFKEFVKLLKRRKDIEVIYQRLVSGEENERLGFPKFKEFLMIVQKESYDEQFIWSLFCKLSQNNGSNSTFLTVEEFGDYLLSKYASYLRPPLNDFTRPINEYFISSSHNTYLLGRQFAGESSIEVYIKALQRGCRCIEIDIWDGSGDREGEPIVCHGRTFTSSIDLRNVAQVIRKHAFITTPYPLIISLEVHCNYSNQLKIKEILEETFGNMLITNLLYDYTSVLPSPLELKHKILLKVKKTSPFHSVNNNAFSSGTGTVTSNNSSLSEDSTTGSKSFGIKRKKLSNRKISDELSSLGVYIQGLKFRNFSLPESKTFNHCFSFGEKTVDSMLKDPVKKLQIDKHNRKFLMRVYPSQYRLNSSNFLPLKYWNIGAQMIATNWQTYDLGQQINEAMFASNDRNGYILKPDYLRKPLQKNPKSFHMRPTMKKIKYEIEIISAHQLHKPKDFKNEELINPYVAFELYGDENCIVENSVNKSPIVLENGFNPIWNFTVRGDFQTSNDLVFAKFSVKTGDYILGLNVVKLDYLNQGYRYIPLNDSNGEEYIYTTLFIKLNYSQID